MGERLVKLTLAFVLVVAACGGGDDTSDDLDDIISDAVQQAQNDDNDGGDDGGGSGSGGGSGTATVQINGGPVYELTITDPCVLLEVGIGAVAEGPDGKLEVAGLPTASNVAFTMGDDLYLAAAAPVEVDGDTITYSGSIGGPDGTSGEIDMSVMCTEVRGLTG